MAQTSGTAMNTRSSVAGIRIVYFPYTRGVSSTQVSKALAAVRGETEGQA